MCTIRNFWVFSSKLVLIWTWSLSLGQVRTNYYLFKYFWVWTWKGIPSSFKTKFGLKLLEIKSRIWLKHKKGMIHEDWSQPSFGSHINPISTRDGRLCPPYTYVSTQFWKPQVRLHWITSSNGERAAVGHWISLCVKCCRMVDSIPIRHTISIP